MEARHRFDVLGCLVDSVDMTGAVARMREWLSQGRAAQVVTFGAEMAVYARSNAAYRDAINGADLVVADTVGIVWASRMLGHPLAERVAGIDLIERLVRAVPCSLFLFGGAEGVAASAALGLAQRASGVHVVGCRHGYFGDADSAEIVQAIRQSGARLLLVATGFPRQELWIRKNLPALGPVVCIGVGGAFDVWAGRVKRAPAFVQRAGAEWLYRLIREPRRLGRQLALPAFAAFVLAQRLHRDSAKPA